VIPSQLESGKAFEYALANALHDAIKDKQKTNLVKNDTYEIARRSYTLFNEKERIDYNLAAQAGVRHILTLEPRLSSSTSKDDTVSILVQSDLVGIGGDVRDVVVIRSAQNWEIGFSAKTNHSAVKHSRLSDNIDFGKSWLDINCSREYFLEVTKIFGELRYLMEQGKKKGEILKWKNLPRKQERFYKPILEAFTKELQRLNDENQVVPSRLLEYLIGKNDFYKVIKTRRQTTIQGFNLHDTLNRDISGRKLTSVSKLKLPTRIIEVKSEKLNKVIITFDGGWSVSFRIHNASTAVEPSLKFDIQLDGIPPSLYTHREKW
jgi:hypothetical protein